MYIRIYFESFILVIFKKPMVFGDRCCSRLSWIGWPYAFGPQTLPSHLCHSVPPWMTVWPQNPRQFDSIFKWRLYMDSTWAKWKKHPPRRFVILCVFFPAVFSQSWQESNRLVFELQKDHSLQCAVLICYMRSGFYKSGELVMDMRAIAACDWAIFSNLLVPRSWNFRPYLNFRGVLGCPSKLGSMRYNPNKYLIYK